MIQMHTCVPEQNSSHLVRIGGPELYSADSFFGTDPVAVLRGLCLERRARGHHWARGGLHAGTFEILYTHAPTSTLQAAFNKWTPEFLAAQMGDDLVSVDITPAGIVDEVVWPEDFNPDPLAHKHSASPLLVRPHIAELKFSQFLRALADPSLLPGVPYVQSQGDNLSTEFAKLQNALPRELPLCAGTLSLSARNLWVGGPRSVLPHLLERNSRAYTHSCLF
jgi:hypothetical protein